jgi:hypothetical protein
MKFARIALLSVAASCLLPFATPAIAELGHPSGCAQCGPVDVTAPTRDNDREGVLMSIGVPFGATALAPERSGADRPFAIGCHVEVWGATYPRQYHTTCP